MDTKLELRIYNNYRAALAEQNRGIKPAHAAQRRNTARKLTVKRYNVSFAEIKRIVNEHDTKNGVTHEHPAGYAQALERQNAFDAADAAYKANPVPCRCGSTELVRVRVDPYEMEIYEKFRLMTSCYSCYRTVEADI
jgi:hypothetical protein